MKGLWLLFFLVAPTLQAQDTEIPDNEIQDNESILRRDHKALQQDLTLITDGLPLTAQEKIDLLAAFVNDHPALPGHTLLLQTRSRLGDLYLLHDAPRALAEFDSILLHA